MDDKETKRRKSVAKERGESTKYYGEILMNIVVLGEKRRNQIQNWKLKEVCDELEKESNRVKFRLTAVCCFTIIIHHTSD